MMPKLSLHQIVARYPVFDWAANWIFGFDFFISYAHADGTQYPRSLKAQLERAGFGVFLDTTDYVAGADLQNETPLQIRKSRKIVVIGRPAALNSDWVLGEVEAALAINKIPIIISVNNAVRLHSSAPIAAKALKHQWLRIEETLDSLDSEPSLVTIAELLRSFDATRQRTKRQRLLAIAVTVLTVVAGVAIWQWVAAVYAKQRTEFVAEGAAFTTSKFIYRLFGEGSRGIDIPGDLKLSLLDEAEKALSDLKEVGGRAEVLRKRGLAAVAVEKSAIYLANGSANKAIDSSQQSVDILRNLADLGPPDADLEIDLAAAYDRLGDARVALEDSQSARDSYQYSRDVLLNLAEPTEQAFKNLASSYEKLSTVSSSDTEAESFLMASFRIREKLVQDGNAPYLSRLEFARVHRQLGQVLLLEDKTRQAEVHFMESLNILTTINPARYRWIDEAESYQGLADVSEKLNQRDNWIEHCRQALSRSANAISDRPDDVAVAGAFLSNSINLGYALSKNGYFEDAATVYASALDKLRGKEAFEKVPQFVRLDARLHASIGDELRDSGKVDEARQEYSTALRKLEFLFDIGAPPSVWRQELLDISRRGADVAFLKADYIEAVRLTQRRASIVQDSIKLRKDDRDKAADVLGELAWYLIFDKQYKTAISSAEHAFAYLSDPIPLRFIFVRENLMYALMFDGQTERALSINKLMGSMEAESYMKWKSDIRMDFNTFLERGFCHPLMAEIDLQFPGCKRDAVEVKRGN
jgi:tetratricopeptide (TPR) repeat protein